MVKYRLFQVKNDMTYTHGFMGLDMMESLGIDIDLSNYDMVYDGVIEGDYNVLEELFEVFNINHPQDFKGRSMSVSDIVEMDGRYYYCDSFGWQEIKI